MALNHSFRRGTRKKQVHQQQQANQRPVSPSAGVKTSVRSSAAKPNVRNVAPPRASGGLISPRNAGVAQPIRRVGGLLDLPEAGPTFPLSLFEDGAVNGIWIDFSDTDTLFQTSGEATTPVTTTNDPIGYALDKSGNDNHMGVHLDNDTYRPPWHEDGYVTFTGSGKALRAVASEFDPVDTSPLGWTFFYVAEIDGYIAASTMIGLVGFTQPRVFSQIDAVNYDFRPLNGNIDPYIQYDGFNGAGVVGFGLYINDVFSGASSWSVVNDSEEAPSLDFWDPTAAIVVTTWDDFVIGGRTNTGTGSGIGKVYEVIAIDKALSAEELEDMHEYFIGKYPIGS